MDGCGVGEGKGVCGEDRGCDWWEGRRAGWVELEDSGGGEAWEVVFNLEVYRVSYELNGKRGEGRSARYGATYKVWISETSVGAGLRRLRRKEVDEMIGQVLSGWVCRWE